MFALKGQERNYQSSNIDDENDGSEIGYNTTFVKSFYNQDPFKP